MSGLASVTERIQQIQSMLGTAAQVSASLKPGTSSSSFAAALGAATGSTTTTSTAPDATATGPTGADVVADAKKYLGIPYVFGSTDPKVGLDCSSLVQRVYKDLGVELPRLVRHQMKEGTAVNSLAEAKPGDLLIFDGHEHIGIYLGNNKVLHAPQPGEKVKISTVWEKPTSIRRIVQTPAAPAASAAATVLRPAALQAAGGSSLGSVPYGSLFTAAGAKYGVSPALLAAVAKVESGYDPNAVSPAGAKGLMQIMPSTAAGLGVNPLNPAQAVDGAARLLKRNLSSFGSLPLALAAYNAGGGAVRKYGGIPPYTETQNYVKKVQAEYARISRETS